MFKNIEGKQYSKEREISNAYWKMSNKAFRGGGSETNLDIIQILDDDGNRRLHTLISSIVSKSVVWLIVLVYLVSRQLKN